MTKAKKDEQSQGRSGNRKVRVWFRILGDKPLMQHNPAGSLKGSGKTGGPKVIPSPEEEAEAGAYRMEDGQLYIKSESFVGSLVGKGGGAANRKLGKSSAISRILAGVDFDIEERCPLFHAQTNAPIDEYEIDTRRAVVVKAGILRSRPLIRDWSCTVVCEIDERFITTEQLLELLNVAGVVAGVGDYRPSCKGRFGKYHATIEKVETMKVFE